MTGSSGEAAAERAAENAESGRAPLFQRGRVTPADPPAPQAAGERAQTDFAPARAEEAAGHPRADTAAAIGDNGAEDTLWRLFSGRRIRSATVAIGLAVAGPILAFLTFATLSSADADTLGSAWFRLLILTDICYLLALTALIGMQIARLVVARRSRSAGSRLHLRMVGFFAGVAAAPAILVAVFFFLVIQLGFEAWFSQQVRSIVANSREVAGAYAREHRETIRGEAAALASELNRLGQAIASAADPRFQTALDRAIRRSRFRDVYILDERGLLIARGSDSFLFAFTPPEPEALLQAQTAGFVIVEDQANDEMRALVRLDGLVERFLYASRAVDGSVLAMMERTDQGVSLYNRLERNRGAWMAQFAALYLGFAVLVLAAAIYLGLWFAERLARPVGRLAAAAQRVRAGDLFVRVKEERGDDEIALLSRTFNRMTEEVKRKQDMLTNAKEESEARRLFTETVLSGVSAGVIGLDADARIRLVNRSGARLLSLSPDAATGRPLIEAAPEFAEIVRQAVDDPSAGVERSIRLLRDNEERELLARIAAERLDPEEGGTVVGYVMTLDDVTALVTAQRMAAWCDVACRIAHEIKNPLTPIQLAAERLKRKYSERLGEDAELFERYTETIVRQTGDIGRMVDAFVRFAKMPSPKMADEDLVKLLNEAVLLQREARPQIRYTIETTNGAVPVRADRGQLMQAFTNVLQNAADSLGARVARDAEAGLDGPEAEIRVKLWRRADGKAIVDVSDNGVGFPKTKRLEILEPYVTTREKGAGLGLAIVLKIIEEHAGELALLDAEPFSEAAAPGACVRFVLPAASSGLPAPAAASDRSARDAARADPEPVS